MLVVVSFVSLLVQIYSIGYMHDDERFRWYYGAISLFTAAMLGVVLADDWLLMYMCWEVMGLASYLLIGFWYETDAAPPAAMKAFLVTRFGDVGFGLALVMIWLNTGHLRVRGGLRRRRDGRLGRTDARRRVAAAACRRDGQERAVPAARLAARRDGRPHAGLGAHPRGHDGRCRRLPGGTLVSRSTRRIPSTLHGHRSHRHDHRASGRARSPWR